MAECNHVFIGKSDGVHCTRCGLHKKNGVKVVSATEVISEGAEGIILESVLGGAMQNITLPTFLRKWFEA